MSVECSGCALLIEEGRCANTNCPRYGIAVGLSDAEQRWQLARRRVSAKRRAVAARDRAMASADAAADVRWKALADVAIVDVARTKNGVGFTADDVWALLDERKVPRPSEARALGPRLIRAARVGLIVKVKEFVLSERESRHAAPIQVWRIA